MAEWLIQPISRKHQVRQFDCGNRKMNEWLRRHALANHENNLGRTQVAVKNTESVLGYYCISSFALIPAHLPGEKMPVDPVPCALLGRLATDVSVQGNGLGKGLLAHALKSAMMISNTLGIYGVVVHAVDERAAAFYRKFDFTPLLSDPLHLILHTRKIRLMFVPE